MKLPWTTLNYRGLDRLADNLPSTLLLLDLQRGNADDVAHAIIRQALCINEQSQHPCGDCKSCHLVDKNTHPDMAFYPKVCKIDQIREIAEQMQKTPSIGKYRVIYLGAIDQYNDYALNALLKTLEEPQLHSHFILSAVSRRAVKPTILSRSYVVSLPPPTMAQAHAWLMSQGFSATQAETALTLYHGNPHQAVHCSEPQDPFAYFAELVAYLEQPQKAIAYLNIIDTLPENEIINILQNQLQIVIIYRQNKLQLRAEEQKLCQPFAASLQTPDINKLHTLYARICALRRPERQQIGKTLNIKALLLEIFDRRTLEL